MGSEKEQEFEPSSHGSQKDNLPPSYIEASSFGSAKEEIIDER